MKNEESKSLEQVWEWKKKAYEDVEHLPLRRALKKRLEDSLSTVTRLGLSFSDAIDEKGAAKVVR